MSLTASMWTSVSGLLVHGEKMNVIGDNIANVNTIGFKSSRMDFQDFVYQTVNAASGPAQVGRGASINAIYGDFSQGGFESSNEATDIAIGGNGFFRVRPKSADDAYYTRAGNFRFDAEGYLVDPHGYVLQGWQVQLPTLSMATSNVVNSTGGTGSRMIGTGVPQDVRLESFSCDPRHTQNMTISVNLDQSCGAEKASSIGNNNPFAAMFENWDATPDAQGKINPPLGMDGFTYQNSIKVYDEGGTPHTLTIYFDPVQADTIYPADPTQNHWEFIVTMDPTEDMRTFGDKYDASGKLIPGLSVPLEDKGLLMAGSISFSMSGEVKNISAYVPTKGGDATKATMSGWVDGTTGTKANFNINITNSQNLVAGDKVTVNIGGVSDTVELLTDGEAGLFDALDNSTALAGWDFSFPAGSPIHVEAGGTGSMAQPYFSLTANNGFDDRNTWIASPISANGYPVFAPNFTGQPQASEVWDPANLPPLDGSDTGVINGVARGKLIELDLGIKNTGKWWTVEGANLYGAGGIYMGGIGPDVTERVSLFGHADRSQPASTAYGSKDGNNFFERYAHQDGYTYGELSSIFIDQDGVMSGRYSNGVTLQLFQITLYDFPSETNLHREGGNLFTQTRESGDPSSGAANSGSFGSVHSNAIEQSNVDLAREFVQMITTQRGFQANSKSITTVDTMLDTVIQMKR